MAGKKGNGKAQAGASATLKSVKAAGAKAAAPAPAPTPEQAPPPAPAPAPTPEPSATTPVTPPPPPDPDPAPQAAEPLSAADLENPGKLTGEALRTLAHRRGVARSEAERMTDEQIRMQLRYITNRQYTEEE